MSSSDSVLRAVEDFEKLLSTSVRKADKTVSIQDSEVGKSLRSRCRELPALIEEVSIVPALSFCYAKAGHKNYEEVKGALEREKGEINDGREKGYAVYLYFALKRLKELNLIEETHLSRPIEALKHLANGNQRVASILIRPYIVQIKKLAEAVFPEEERR